MSHGFSRFGPPTARERFHQSNRPASTIAMLLPTILATLFLFTVVITLNKASSLSRGGKIIRLISVDDLFPSLAEAEAMREKAYYEAPPPPSPEAVLAGLEGEAPALPANLTLDGGWNPYGVQMRPVIRPLTPSTIQGFTPSTEAPEQTRVPRTRGIPVVDIPLPPVAPDTSMPAPAPAPRP